MIGNILSFLMVVMMKIAEALDPDCCNLCEKPVKSGHIYCKSCIERMRRNK